MFPLCGLKALGSATPPSALAPLQPLASLPDRRLTLDLDVIQAVLGVGGLGTSPSAAALRLLPVSGMGARRSVTPPSAFTPLQPLASPSDRRLTLDLDVTQAVFGVGGLGTLLSATALRILPVRNDALSSGSTAASGIGLPSQIFFVH